VSSMAVTVLAHQGGWDEALMVLTPVAVFVLLLWLANSRANRVRDERAAAEAADHPGAAQPADPSPDRDA
jgi:cyanate permease